MKIVYFANHGNKGSDDTEGHIAHALRSLGHEVVCYQEMTAMTAVWRACESADLFLFHKGGPHIFQVLPKVQCPKVFWYFDKVWHDRPEWFKKVLPLVDFGFLTDGDFLKASESSKLALLHQGIGDRDTSLGKPNARYTGQICFIGDLYAGREDFAVLLQNTFGPAFQAYNNAFNRDLYDLCASVPIIVAPKFPATDQYWSSRIYMILGSGGFLIHPRCKGLEDDGLVPGIHFVGYDNDLELIQQIKYYLANTHEREIIKQKGYEFVTKKLTYTRRCQELLRVIQQRQITGTKE